MLHVPSWDAMQGPIGLRGVHCVLNNLHSCGLIFPTITKWQLQPGGISCYFILSQKLLLFFILSEKSILYIDVIDKIIKIILRIFLLFKNIKKALNTCCPK